MGVPVRIRRSGALVTRDIQFRRDRELQKDFQRIKDCRREFEELSGWLIENLDLPANKKRAAMVGFLKKFIPNGFYKVAPAKFTQWIEEETNAVDMVEGLLRKNVGDVQDAVINLKNSAKAEEERLEDFAADIKEAESENWDAQRLHDYLNEASELHIHQDVQELLDENFDILPPEEKEKRRLELLNRLKGNAIGRKRVVEAHGKVCALALQVLHTGACQYFDFVTIARPLKVIHKAAEGMLDMNTAAYAAKDVIKKILRQSAEAFECITEATAKMSEFAISSPDTIALIEDASKKLDGHLLKLEDARSKILQIENKNKELSGEENREQIVAAS